MKLDSITLHNFKCFEGTCSINGLGDKLTSEKNIILLGGLNGAGKTTLFEAILLCLYGKRNKTLWPTKGTKYEIYQNYIVAVTNNNAKLNEIRPELWIEVGLRDIELGGLPQILYLKRSWTIDAESADILCENLTLYDEHKNYFDFVSETDWEDFINELIPYDIFQFFFFDGEKIQDFVRDEDKEFAVSLEKVLGITLYEQLKNDLEEVRKRIYKKYAEDEDAKIRLSQIDTAIAESERTIDHKMELINVHKEDIKKIQDRIEEIDRQSKRITRVKAQTLEEFNLEKEALVQRKSIHEEKIFDSIREELPFIIMAPLCNELLDQLIHEQQLNEFISAQKALEPKINLITKQLFEDDESSPPLTKNQRNFYSNKLRKILAEILTEKPSGLEHIRMLHRLAKNDIENIKSKINLTHEIVNNLSNHLHELQEIEPKLKEISRAEQRTDDPIARELYEERGKLTEKLETIKEKIESVQMDIDIERGKLASMRRQRTDYENKVERTIQMKEQIDYTRRLRETIEEFSHKLRATKVDKLQELTLQMWKKLSHKKDQVNKIIINPDRQFSIELYDMKDRLIDKTKLSAGEKEILAIALIWALSKLTNRSLPVVIDTPLGRLDTIHRANIARNYFSNASHQVLLLSTNSEIVGKELVAIKPFVAKKYLLQRDNVKKVSQITDGYFE